MGLRRFQSGTAYATAAAPHHVGGGPGFVDKHQTPGIKRGLAGGPRAACGGHIRPVLFACPEVFFGGMAAGVEDVPHDTHTTGLAPLLKQPQGQFLQRDVGFACNLQGNPVVMAEQRRPPVAALRLGRDTAGRGLQLQQLHSETGAHHTSWLPPAVTFRPRHRAPHEPANPLNRIGPWQVLQFESPGDSLF